MKLNHKQKTFVFKLLDAFPANSGMWLYHTLQGISNSRSVAQKIKAGRKSLQKTQNILRANDIHLKDANCIEMGSGWMPIFPYFLLTSEEVASVATYDVNKHYQASNINKINSLFSEDFPDYQFQFSGSYQLDKRVEYFPETSVADGSLAEADFIFSRFVLEHVPPEIMRDLHQSFSEKIKDNCYVFHLISPSDHRAYSDKSLSLYDFLKYSETQWNGIQTSFDYHNRLRLPQYLDIFREQFEIVHLDYTFLKEGDKRYSAFKEVNLHEDFQHFTDEELTAGSIAVLLKKKVSSHD